MHLWICVILNTCVVERIWRMHVLQPLKIHNTKTFHYFWKYTEALALSELMWQWGIPKPGSSRWEHIYAGEKHYWIYTSLPAMTSHKELWWKYWAFSIRDPLTTELQLTDFPVGEEKIIKLVWKLCCRYALRTHAILRSCAFETIRGSPAGLRSFQQHTKKSRFHITVCMVRCKWAIHNLL